MEDVYYICIYNPPEILCSLVSSTSRLRILCVKEPIMLCVEEDDEIYLPPCVKLQEDFNQKDEESQNYKCFEVLMVDERIIDYNACVNTVRIQSSNEGVLYRDIRNDSGVSKVVDIILKYKIVYFVNIDQLTQYSIFTAIRDVFNARSQSCCNHS